MCLSTPCYCYMNFTCNENTVKPFPSLDPTSSVETAILKKLFLKHCLMVLAF